MTTDSRTTFTAIGFVVVAAIAGTCGYLYAHAKGGSSSTMAAATSAQTTPAAAATTMVTNLANANWSKSAFTPYESSSLQAWLSNPKNVKTLKKGLTSVGTLKGGLTVAESKTESKGGYSGAFVVLTGDFTKGRQFVNVSMVKEGSSWKINNLSVVSQDRVFAEKTYIIGSEILNKLSRTNWSTKTVNTFATKGLQSKENQTQFKSAISELSGLGNVNRVNQMLKFHYDGKTQTADLLLDVQFSKTRRPVLMVMKLDNNRWMLDGISVMNYKEVKGNKTASTTSQKTKPTA